MIQSIARRAVLMLLVAAGLSQAKPTWMLTTSDFTQKQVTLDSLGDQNRVTVGKETRTLQLDDILELTRPGSARPKGLILRLASGDELVGTPQKLTADSVVYDVDGIGSIEVPVSRLAGLFRDAAPSIDISAKRTEDSVRLVNGDSVTGILSDIDSKSVSIQKADGSTTPLPLESVQMVLFAQTPAPQPEKSTAARFRISLTSGSRLTATDLLYDGTRLGFTPVGGKAVTINEDQVIAIERLNGPVVWLSTRTPTESVYTPYFDGQFPAKMDRNVLGQPIRFGQQVFARGIGVHSKSRITFAVEPGDKTFRTRYAMDGQLSYADVDVRILVDDKVVHEAKSFKSGKMSDVVEVPLEGAKNLTLEVDYGQGYDVQDRLNWIEPAILQK